MSEESGELFILLKELVNRLQKLEEVMYNSDNMLMKSGFVKVETPRPDMQAAATTDGLRDTTAIAKMSWDDLNSFVTRLEGKV